MLDKEADEVATDPPGKVELAQRIRQDFSRTRKKGNDVVLFTTPLRYITVNLALPRQLLCLNLYDTSLREPT